MYKEIPVKFEKFDRYFYRKCKIHGKIVVKRGSL